MPKALNIRLMAIALSTVIMISGSSQTIKANNIGALIINLSDETKKDTSTILNKIRKRIDRTKERKQHNKIKEEFSEAFNNISMKDANENDARKFVDMIESGLESLRKYADVLLSLVKGTYSREEISKMSIEDLYKIIK